LNELVLYNGLIKIWFLLAVMLFIILFFIAAPYGRFSRMGWGPVIADRIGWLIMESASVIVFTICFIQRDSPTTTTILILYLLWEIHYVHRAFIYPFSRSSSTSKIPLSVISAGFLFNVINSYLNGRYIFSIADGYTNEWLLNPRFTVGIVLFATGFFINRQADTILSKLRKHGEKGHLIPYGGLYRWISCPNYFGELITWMGWAVMAWSLAGLTFAVWTAANLIPRARANHKWYLNHFPGYPPSRKALFPWIW